MARVTAAAKSSVLDAEPQPEAPPKLRERLPVAPTFKLNFPQMKEYWTGIHADFPQRVWGYLYRYFPRLNRPDPHYIDKYNEPLDNEREILQKWGTGDYEVRLYDTNFKRGNELCRCVVKFKEPYSERPPVLDPLELDVGHDSNRSYIEWRRSNNLPVPGDSANRNSGGGATDGAGAVAVKALADIATKKQEPPDTVEGEAASAAFEIVTKAASHAIETVKAQADPTALLKVVEAVKGSNNGNAEFFTTMLKVQADSSAQQTALITKLLDRPSGQNELVALVIKVQADASQQQTSMMKSMFDFMASTKEESRGGSSRLKETVETVAIIRDLFQGGGEAETGPGGWVRTALNNPSVNRTIEMVGGALMNWSQAHLMQQRVPAGAMTGAQPSAAERQPTPAPDGTVHYPGEPAPQQQPVGTSTEDAMNQQFLYDFFLPRGMSLINAIEEGIPGDEYAQNLYEIHLIDRAGSGMSPGQHASIKGIGKDKLISLLGMAAAADPRIRATLSGKQSLVIQFVDQFLSWEPQEPETVPPPPGFEKVQ
jgi:hypothetical protein